MEEVGKLNDTALDSNLTGTAGSVEELAGGVAFIENSTWLNSKEAAAYLRLPSVGILRVMVCKRQIPFYKLGNRLRFKRIELNKFIEASLNGGS